MTKISRDTSLSYAIPAVTSSGAEMVLRTYGDALDFLEQLTPEQREQPHWEEIRVYLLGEKLSAKAHTTRLIERAISN